MRKKNTSFWTYTAWTLYSIHAMDGRNPQSPCRCRNRGSAAVAQCPPDPPHGNGGKHRPRADARTAREAYRGQDLGVAREGRRRDRPRLLRHHNRPSRRHPPCLCQKVGQNATERAGNRPQQNEGSEAMTKLATLKKRLMKNPKFRKEYERVDAEFSIVEALINARTVAKLSQAEVAKRIGTTQSAIARLEAGNTKPTIPTLRRYAEATGKKLRIELAG